MSVRRQKAEYIVVWELCELGKSARIMPRPLGALLSRQSRRSVL